MLTSPFTFYRGAAAIMAADLNLTPSTGLSAQLCGDAHLSNFGGFAAPDRELVFDINDFDETLPGPWEWDVKRLGASFEIAARDRDFPTQARIRIVRSAVQEYRQTMRRLAKLSNLDLWYMRLNLAGVIADYGEQIAKKDRQVFDQNVAKARSKDRRRASAKLTERCEGKLRIASQPPLLEPIRELLSPAEAAHATDWIRGLLGSYRESLSEHHRHLLDGYRFVDCARKVVGVGSVGTRSWIALLEGRDESDPLLLQIKEAETSVLEPFTAPSRFDHQGRRVVEGQRLIQASGDILLGWMTARGVDGVERNFYVRQMWDQKASARVDRMSPKLMSAYAQMCGSTLARGHARSGDRIAIAAYMGRKETFDDAVTRFSQAYADQNKLDYQALKQAGRDGVVEVAEDP